MWDHTADFLNINPYLEQVSSLDEATMFPVLLTFREIAPSD